MSTQKLFRNIPSRKKFHSCIMMSYSFNFHYFESYVLGELNSRGIINVSAFVDGTILQEQLGHLTGGVRKMAKKYTLTGIDSIGVFHPKINLFLGNKEAFVQIGSGNLTSAGHGKNVELWSGIYMDKNTGLALLHQIWEYVEQFTNNLDGVAKRKILWAKNNCTLLNDFKVEEKTFIKVLDNTKGLFLFNRKEQSIYEQLHDFIAFEKLKTINCLAPFFDEHGKVLLAFKEDAPKADIHVILQDKMGNPPSEMPKTKGITFYKWNEVVISDEIKNIEKRFLHAKFFHFVTDKKEYLLVGSANASIQAFGGIDKRAVNDEACMLFVRSLSAQSYLEELGIQLDSSAILKQKDIKKEEWQTQQLPKSTKNSNACIRLKSVDLAYRNIIVSYEYTNVKKDETSSIKLQLLNSWGEVETEDILLKEGQFRYTLPSKEEVKPAIAQIIDDSGNILSNKVVVHNEVALRQTNPSARTQNIQNFITNLENDDMSLLERMEYYTNIMQAPVNRKSSNAISHAKRIGEVNGVQKKVFDDDISSYESMSYEELCEINRYEKDKAKRRIIPQNHASVKITDTLFGKLLRQENMLLRQQEKMETQSNLDDYNEEEESKKEFDRIECSPHKDLEDEIPKIKKRYLDFFQYYPKLIDVELKKEKSKMIEENQENSERELTLADMSMFLFRVHTLIESLERTTEITGGRQGDKQKPVAAIFLKANANRDGFYYLANDILGAFIKITNGSVLMSFEYEEDEKQYFNYVERCYYHSLFVLAIMEQIKIGSRDISLRQESLADLLKIKDHKNLEYYFKHISRLCAWKNFNLNRGLELLEIVGSFY